MEKILLNMVKIIIIGSFFRKITVFCQEQFLSLPPIPYYQNEGFYMPEYDSLYHEPVALYFPNENIHPSPTIFPGLELYSPPQLFHQDKNYHPPQAPLGPSQMPEILSYEINPVAPTFMPPPPTVNIPPQETYQKPLEPVKVEAKHRPPKQQIKVQSKTVQKHDNYSPFYLDDFTKNYHDEDYSDYSEDSSSHTDPYRFFERVKTDTVHHDFPPSRIISNPYVYPTVKSTVYDVKTPLTLLPSRFPPRVEQFLERIQNYFSTYTQQGQQNSHNQSVSTTPHPLTSVSGECTEPTTLATSDKKNTTEEIPVTFTANLSPVGVTTVAEQVTENPEVITINSEEIGKIISPTPTPFVENVKDVQMEVQNMQFPNEVVTNVPVTTEKIIIKEDKTTPGQSPLEIDSQQTLPAEISSENGNFIEEQPVNNGEGFVNNSSESSVVFKLETKKPSHKCKSPTESAHKEHNTEDYINISTTNEIFHGHADHNG